MTARRLLGTAIGMALIAGALAVLTPSVGESWTALRQAQTTADEAGPDVLVLHLAGLLAWLVWAWGVTGLALTAGSTLPGSAGRLASGTLRRVLPAGARRVAAVALGVGLGLAPPVLGGAMGPAGGTAVAQASAPGPSSEAFVPDWPVPSVSAAGDLPDWPQAPAAGEHVVVRGDCLWDIAERRLAMSAGRDPGSAEVAAAVRAWWQANADVIGADPDRLLPGQVLRPPALP